VLTNSGNGFLPEHVDEAASPIYIQQLNMLLRFFHKNRRIMHEQFQTQIKITAKPQISGLIRKNNASRPGGLVSSRARGGCNG
jgi:hypothetical protein